MKKVIATLISLVTVGLLSATVYAYTVGGQIWTGKPGFLGIGYYCTAAQVTSSNADSYDWAYAKTYTTNSSYVSSLEYGNNIAVANTGSTKPLKGYGAYGRSYTIYQDKWFYSSAWD